MTASRQRRPSVASDRPRSTRGRPAKSLLSEQAVVDAALAILRAEGMAAVSMRRVAAALDTSAGALYVYVDDRQFLLAAMFDRVVASIPLEPVDAGRWREQLHALLRRLRDTLVAHPGLAAAAMIAPPQSEATFGMLETLLGLLLAAGLDAHDAAWTADALSAQVTFAAIEAEQRGHDATELAADIGAGFAALPAERFPLITTHRNELVSGTTDDRFTFAVDALLDGALARA